MEIDGKWENTTEAEVWDELLHRLVVHERAEDIQLGMEPVKFRTALLTFNSRAIDDLFQKHTMRPA